VPYNYQNLCYLAVDGLLRQGLVLDQFTAVVEQHYKKQLLLKYHSYTINSHQIAILHRIGLFVCIRITMCIVHVAYQRFFFFHFSLTIYMYYLYLSVKGFTWSVWVIVNDDIVLTFP